MPQEIVQYLDVTFKLILAFVLGGIIGFERESIHRPAGFRTHVLVCVSSALVMVTSMYMFQIYNHVQGIDPSRLATNVLTGIGFIGAGTILKEGFNVKGLTTAASLWAVACVGLAVGMGFYFGAIFTTVLIYITLVLLKGAEEYFYKKRKFRIVSIDSLNLRGQVTRISEMLEAQGIAVRHLDMKHSDDSKYIHIRLTLIVTEGMDIGKIADEINKLEGIQQIYHD